MSMKFKAGQRVKVKRTGLKGIIAPDLTVWQNEYLINLDNGKISIVNGSFLLPTA